MPWEESSSHQAGDVAALLTVTLSRPSCSKEQHQRHTAVSFVTVFLSASRQNRSLSWVA